MQSVSKNGEERILASPGKCPDLATATNALSPKAKEIAPSYRVAPKA
jgi:hypothetical protein